MQRNPESITSAVATHRAPLEAVGVAVLEDDLDVLPSPPRHFAYTRRPFHHECDAGIWRPDDQASWKCARWITETGKRILLTVPAPSAAVELSQGAWMLRGFSLLPPGPDMSRFGMADRVVNEDLDWWEGFFFACVHFGLDAWVVNLDSGRLARSTNSSVMCVSHLEGDSMLGGMEDFFEYRASRMWRDD